MTLSILLIVSAALFCIGLLAALIPLCAVMPGMCLCCFAGMPIGLWSLSVLIKPEVSSAFH